MALLSLRACLESLLEGLSQAELDGLDDPVLVLRLDLELAGHADDPDDQPAAGEAVADEGPDLHEPAAEGPDPVDPGRGPRAGGLRGCPR